MRARALALLAAALAAAACTVGPDFRVPDPPAVDRYTPAPPPAAPGMPRLVRDRDIPAQWWEVFGSAELDALVRRALAQGPTLDQARARLVQAQELRTARHGAVTYPQFDATFGAQRQRIDPATFGFPQAPNPGPFNVFSVGGSVAYRFDLFGGARRDLEALAAEVDYQAYELEAARLTLAANVVVTAIRRASLAAQAEVVAGILAAQRRQLAIVERRHGDGGVAWLDVQNQRALVAQTEALLPVLEAQRAQAGHVLAVLMGDPPGAASVPEVRLAELHLPAELPLRLPSELVRQRPDIRASEALLHKASANVGVATADQYPKLVVTGAFSSGQLDLSHLLGSGINIWNIGVNALQPVFRHDELEARRRAAVAAYDQAAAGYRIVVLQGLQNVADVLRALEADALTLAARSEQAARADDAFRIARARYDAGGVSLLAVLDAERTRLQAELDRVQAQAARNADAAALFQALGGGWQSGAEP
ncbi:MAG: efflux transporter outer membrane subunit [Betaproteobacteria bacterium]|nr:efflux transporter outer membrane subunit [Betaproteobacteria bacterium]